VLPAITGVAGTGGVEPVIIAFGGSIVATGVSGTGAVGTISRGGWTTIDDSQTPTWVDINKAA
jgi:hypothetical protein